MENRTFAERNYESNYSSLKSGDMDRRSGSHDSSTYSTYKATVVPHQLIIQRTLPRSSSSSRVYSEKSLTLGTLVPGSSLASHEVDSVRFNREKDKKDMQDLNLRFARYIETVRFLEAQNKQLDAEIRNLKLKWGKETSQVRLMFEADLEEARRIKDDLEKEKARVEIRVTSLIDELDESRRRNEDDLKLIAEYRQKLENQNQRLIDLEANNGILLKRLELVEGDRDRDKNLISELRDTVTRHRMDLDNQSLLYVDADNKRQSLEEELEFLKQVHEQEMKELSILTHRDTTAVNREFWKNEMERCLKEIQELYDSKLDNIRDEGEAFYALKINEIRSSNQRNVLDFDQAKESAKKYKTVVVELRDKLNGLELLKSNLQNELDIIRHEKDVQERDFESENNNLRMEVAKLKAELEGVWQEIDKIRSTKDGLELEIAAYRKLLEGEENRNNLYEIVNFSMSEGGESGGVIGGSGVRGGGSISGGGVSGSKRVAFSSSESVIGGRGRSSGFGGEASGSAMVGSISGGASMGGASESRFEMGGVSGGGGGSFGSMSTSSSSLREFGGYNKGDAFAPGQVNKKEITSKTTFQRSARGPVAVSECSPDGKFVVIENTGRKEESLGGFTIRRSVNGLDKTEFSFDKNFVLKPGAKAKIWASNQKPLSAPASDLEGKFLNWAVGENVNTGLYGPTGEEKAMHILTTVYSA